MEWWKAERAMTSPSTRVTVTQTRDTRRCLAEGGVGRRPVQVEQFADAGVGRGDDHRPLVTDIANVAHETLVEDGVDGGPLVTAPLR